MEAFIQIVQQVGFPIAVAIAMFIMLQGEQKQHREESERITGTMNELKETFNTAIHEQESTIAEAINNNTLVIQKLIDKLERE